MKNRICLIMYKMFLDENIPEMDMDEYECMWETLLNHNGFNTAGLEHFCSEINCKASNNWEFFEKTFDKYFKNEE